MMAAKFTGDDLQLQFDNGAAFSLPADANYNSGIGEVVISLLSGERFFNTDEDIVFDLSQTEHDYNIDFEWVLPSGLEADDIAVFLYSPGSSKEEVDLVLVEFDYDQASGKLSSTFTAPTAEAPVTMLAHSLYSQAVRTASNANRKYTRLAISYASHRDLADGPVGNTIPMPFYEQTQNTCWAAVTKMIARAYAPVNDRSKEFRLHDIVRYMGHSDFDGGLWKWTFTRHVPAYLQSRTGVEFRGSTFLRTKKLESENMRLINEDRPVILNLNYPDVGQHQILVIGYEWKRVSDHHATFRLLYHNPQGKQSGGTTVDMYRWDDFDWLMKDKWRTSTVQIVYAVQPPPSDRALQTLATPIYNISLWHEGQALGDLQFYDSLIHMVYNRAEPRGYSWVSRRDDKVVDAIPAEDTHISFTQMIFNAAENTAFPSLLIEAHIIGKGDKIFEEGRNLALPPGTTRHDFEIDLADFAAEEERDILVLVQLKDDNYNFQDGYDFRFTLAPKDEEEEEGEEGERAKLPFEFTTTYGILPPLLSSPDFDYLTEQTVQLSGVVVVNSRYLDKIQVVCADGDGSNNFQFSCDIEYPWDLSRGPGSKYPSVRDLIYALEISIDIDIAPVNGSYVVPTLVEGLSDRTWTWDVEPREVDFRRHNELGEGSRGSYTLHIPYSPGHIFMDYTVQLSKTRSYVDRWTGETNVSSWELEREAGDTILIVPRRVEY